MLERINRAERPSSSFRDRARLIAASEKSTPVASAPNRAQDMVSIPKWHWRWSRLLPDTGPISSRSISLRVYPARLEAVHVVEGGGCMDGSHLVPVVEVGLQPFVHDRDYPLAPPQSERLLEALSASLATG